MIKRLRELERSPDASGYNDSYLAKEAVYAVSYEGPRIAPPAFSVAAVGRATHGACGQPTPPVMAQIITSNDALSEYAVIALLYAELT